MRSIKERTFLFYAHCGIITHMKSVEVKCIVEEGAKLPEYKTAGAAGADLSAFLPSPVTIAAGSVGIIPTGLKIEVPFGYEAQVRPRSGLAAKHGITVLNTPGTIDSDYRGEVCVIMANLGKETFTVNNGERIAQMVIAPVTLGDFVKADALSSTVRGEGGFGSTGV